MKVNILMATYNGEKYLEEQIASIQNQTFQDWELLIRDDGSTDQTRAIIQRFEASDQRIRLINPNSMENMGVIKSFYTLVKHEVADFYFFSDQDDIWLPNKLQLCLEAAQDEIKDLPLMIYTDLRVVDQELNVIHDSMIKSQSHHANTELRQELTENTVTGGTSLINHALAQQWQVYEGILMHDWYLALLASALGKLLYLDSPTELYRQHENNVLGARTWAKRIRTWLKPHQLVDKYWWLISSSQKQAQQLLSLDLSKKDREMVEAFIGIMKENTLTRMKHLKKYRLAKNRWFHTLVFTTLIVTKFGYRSN